MQDQESKSKMKIGIRNLLKNKYLDMGLIFLVVMGFGLFLALSASAQQPDQVPGMEGIAPGGAAAAPESPNQPPVLKSLKADMDSPQAPGSAVTFTATASDPEEDPLQYRFFLDDQPKTRWSDSPNWTWDSSQSDVGSHTIEVKVRDGNHNSDGDDSKTMSFAIAAPPNQPPILQNLEADKSSPQAAGTAVTFMATASDPEGDPLQYQFSLDGQPRTRWSDDPSWTTSEMDTGSHTIEVSVRDGNHDPSGDNSKTVNFVIAAPPNQPPVLQNLGADKDSPQAAGTAVTFTASASDPEGDPLQFMFLLDGQPRTQWSDNPGWTWDVSENDIGSHTIEVRVKDGNHNPGGDDSKTMNFAIAAPPNQPPVLQNLGADKDSPQAAGTAVTFTASASDPEGDPLLYRFFLDGQPRTQWSDNPSWTWDSSQNDIGSHAIEVRVKDGKHSNEGDDSKTMSFAIAAPPNQPPVLQNFGADKDSPQVAGTAITFTATASDPEGDPLQFMFSLDGQARTQWSENPSWSTSEMEIGSHTVEIKVKDGKHDPNGDDSKTMSFAIAAPPNQPSVLQNLGADKDSPQAAGTAVTFTASASDPEGDPLQYQFSLDGQPSKWSDNPSWTTSEMEIGSHTIEVKVRDGKHDPNGDDSKTVNFAIAAPPNQPPVLQNFGVDKDSPQAAGTAVTFTATASDPEGDPLQFIFSLDGQPKTKWSENPSWTTSEMEIGSHTVEVKVRDGKHDPNGDDSRTVNFAIAAPPNQPPVLQNLGADKDSPQTAGTIVTWAAQASDPEGDPVSFRFLLNGTPATGWQPQNQWAWTASEIGTSEVMVQVKDDQHAGPEGADGNRTAEFTINAPAPEIAPAKPEVVPAKLNQSPALSSLTPDVDSPQVVGTIVTWTAQASDPEDDPISFRFLLNGTAATDWQPLGQWAWTANEIGKSEVEVQVKDDQHSGPEGADGNRTTEFTINAPAPEVIPVKPEVVPARLNESPALTSLNADKPSPQLAGSVITWTAQASDPENDPIAYRFLLNGTAATDWQPQNQWAWTANEIGTSEVEVQVRDDQHAGPEGANGNRTAEFSINAPAPQPAKPQVVPAKLNQSPALSSLTPDVDSPQVAGTIVTWTAEASDPENDPILFRFLLNGTAVTDWQLRNEWDWTANEIGKSEVEVQVKDDQHAGPEGADGNRTAEFTINAPAPKPSKPEVAPALNQSPVVSSLAPDKTSPQPAGSVINWTAEATDPENDLIFFRFLLNGTPETDWQSQGQFTWTANEIGTSEVVVQAKDDRHAGPEGEGGNRSAKFTISAPAPLPAPTKNVTNVTTPEAPAPVIAENRTPVVNTLTPEKTSPQLVGSVIAWTANATDPDKDPILYRFFLNGPGTGGSWKAETEWATSNTWTWNATDADAGGNQVRVWARDGKHARTDAFDSEQSAYFTITRPSLNITGTAFDDRNGNGAKDSGEPGLAGWTINLQKPDKSEVSTITKDDGSYRFDLLEQGTYTVSEVANAGWRQTSPEGPYSVELKEADVTGKDFGNRLSSYSISGMKFNDLDSNGVNDGEPGLAGWTIQLSRDGNVINTTPTRADGSYSFGNLAPGTYTVSESDRPGWTRTAPREGIHSVELKDADVAGKNFGNKEATILAISGAKFHDVNGNGVRDDGEPGMAGWTIQLARDGGVVNATTTAQDGSYSFGNLAPGAYMVSEVAQDGWIQTVPKGPYSVELKDANVTGRDFGNKGNLSISGVKFYDANGNGVQDSDEPGIPGQPVKLVQSGKEIATTTSGSDGSYTFSNLQPGTYEVDDPITISITITSIVVKPIPIIGSYSISGVKFNDVNGNGAKDPGELGIANWGIDLVLVVPGPAPDILLAQVQTDANGAYTFHNLFPGTYKVSELAKQGWTPTTATDHTVSIPGSASNQNFGNRAVSPPGTASIWGFKFNDLNNNGANNGEPGLAGWTIQLRNASNNSVIKTATTDATGWYSFTSLQPGGYKVSELAKPGWTQTAPPGGAYTFALAAGQTKLAVDFGNRNNNLPPTNPTLASNKPSPQRVGTHIRWTAGATDPEGDPLQFRFFVRGPEPGHSLQEDTGYSGNNVWTWSTSGYQAGTYQVEVWIRDGLHAGPGGFDVKKTVSFTLTSPNLPPNVRALYADRPAPQYAGSWIKWTALASDPEGDPIQYRYFLRGPSTGGFWIDQTGWGKNSRWVWRTDPLDVGFNEVLVAVRDGSHAGPGGSDDYAIEDYFIVSLNQPPVITGFGANVPSPQPIGVAVRWQATAFDPEHNLLFYRYWLKGPSTGGFWRLARDWSTDPTWTWATSPQDIGTSEVQVQVRDGFHASPAGWDDDAGALFTVLRPNLPPKLDALKPDLPSPQAAGTPVRWTALASDPDADQLLFRFWLNGPSTGNKWVVAQDWSPLNQWVWASTPADGGDYSVYVYVRDGRHAGPGGYDAAAGQLYTMRNPLDARRLSTGAAQRNRPSLLFTGDGYLLAFQSMELGKGNKGDVALQKFDLAWNKLKSIWVSSGKAYEDSPTLASVGGYYYVAYVSAETGNNEIFVKKYDPSLKLLETKRLTNAPTDQGSPSLIAMGNSFYLAYQSWETGPDSGGDIFLTRYDQSWRPQENVQLTDQRSSQDRPSLAFAEGNFWVAYVSTETGNKEIFMKRLDANLDVQETRRMTSDRADQDYPSLRWLNGQFMLLYSSQKVGNYEIVLDRYLRDWKPIDSTVAVAAPGDQTAPTIAFSLADGLYWVAYASRDREGQNIYVKPLKLSSPSVLKPCEIAATFSATRANNPYTLTLKFYNNYGELADPVDLSFGWSPQDAVRQGDQLQRTAVGTFQLKSVFGARGDKSFRVGANIDDCAAIKAVSVKVT